MSRKNIENIYSLSPMQQGILFHTLYDSTPGVYLVELAWTLRGQLDPAAFQRAWQEVVDRHPILRTAFVWERLEKPMQIVRKRVQITVEEVDLRDVPTAERAGRMRSFQEEFSRRGFDFTRAPLMRLALLRLEDEAHRFIWSSHHLLLDGWSLPLVVREAFALYEAHANNREAQLERSRPYGDYIAWLARQDLGKAETFWRKQLQGFGAPTPFRVERGDVDAEEGFEERTLLLGEPESAGLQGFARHHQLTVSTLVQGAWALLLARYSGEEEVVYGSTVSGRSAPVAGIDRMVGLFINTLPVRVKVPEGVSALTWLKGLQDQQAELREYEYSPLIQVQGWSDLARGVPLFESQVAFENYPSAETLLQASNGLQVTETQMSSQAHYPLTFIAVSRRSLGLRISYDKRRFERATIDRMLVHLSTLLASIAREPSKGVWDLPLIPEVERQRLVVEWNDTAASYPMDECAHRLFELSADKTPAALALVAGDVRLSYRELDVRANRLAHHLVKLGVGPDAVVALCVDRSADLIVGLLGILKAGGAYLPIDPAYPPQRIAQIRDEAGARIVVTQAAFAHALEGQGVSVVRLDGDAAALAAESDARPVSGATGQNLVYVLFTSGSTGKPKGVAVEHRNLVNYVRGVATRLGLPEGASYAHVSTFSADLGNTVLFPPLCLGGVLHVIPQELTTDPQGLGEYFRRESIDCLKIVPSHLSALLSGAHPERVLPCKLLVLGGEGSTWELVSRVEKLTPDTRIMNHYGPTETTVGVITYPVEKGKRVAGTPILPLGRPLPNSRIYVLDRHRAPMPIGVPGEVFIGGAGVARGYLRQPELTQERFLPDPFRPGERVYRTGDRARILADGTILFLGRVDYQVKLRGYRIELGEIEAALLAHSAVREAVVLVHEDTPGDQHLVGYVVSTPDLDAGAAFDVAALRVALAQRLPEYMIPPAFVVLAAMPLTPNGKVDRRALATLEQQKQESEAHSYVAPRNPIEEVIASIWCDIFDKERVGVHEKFADLGGHSLLAIQIIARAREAFQVDVALRAIFESPTIAGLAEQVETAMHEGEGTPPPPIERVSRDGELLLSFAQERLWFLHQLEPQSPYYNVPSALRLSGKLDLEALERALREIVRRHEVLRTTFRAVSGKPLQIVHPEVELRLGVVRWPELRPEEREEAARKEAAEEARRPFDLATGPVFRAGLLVLGEDDHVLLLTLHHIVSDGWTRGILNRELSTLYRAYQVGEDAALPEVPIQYADYAQWQRRWLSGEVLDRQIAYWKTQLNGAPQAIDLPTDRPRPRVQTYRGGQRLKILPREIGVALKELARREGVTLYMILLSALDVLLHRWTGQRDVVVGTSVSNRNRAETERLIGFFINALVLRTEVIDAQPFTELLQRVREVCLGAYAHQDMPFERLVQELQPEPDPSRAPLFQVIFTMQNAPGEAMEMPGLQLRGMRTESATVKYDLTFLMGEGKDGALGVSIEYNVDLFDGTTIDRMVGHLSALLEGIAKDASRRVADLAMIPDDERQEVLVTWNDTAASYSTDDCVHELFEAQAEVTPDAIAVTSGAAHLTFRQLDARANRLAHYLRSQGVGPESVVGLCLGRSVEVIVALLGILKAGGAYLPLDPTYPAPRLAQLALDAGARVIVSEHRFTPALPASAALVRLDGDAAAIAAERDARVVGEVTSSNLAYVLFTSGSTGKPKGVAIEHRNLVNYVRGVATRLELPAGASYAHVSTFSADLGNTVLFPPLCLGGTLHLIPEELTTDPIGLGAYFEEHRIDCLKIVPSHLSALLSGPHPERVIPRKLLVLGGEASSWELIDRIEKLSPATRIMNHYGPTETTVGVVTYSIDKASRPATPIVPLGRPLPNTQVYLLDPELAPTPVGVPGELHIGGAGVARGYLGQPEPTRPRFLGDPFSKHPGARLYRTGDRARALPDGTLVFLGRLDFQVKIRGYRVELGEIEAALGAHAAVKDAVVLAQELIDEGDSAPRPPTPGDKRLVAYVVPTSSAGGLAAAELQSHLEQRLPEYMVPTTFVVLPALPLTANGKIDRKALVALGREHQHGEAYLAPRTPVEEVLASIWGDVFGREQIGVHDRFNDLGGHSLLAIQIIARARDAFNAQVPLRAMFEAPTIAGLAERVEAAIREEAGEGAPPPITRVPRGGGLPLSFAQERLWFLDKLDPGSASYNVPARRRLTGQLDVGALERTLQEIVRRHEVLRTTFATIDGKPVQIVHDHLVLALQVEDVGGGNDPVQEVAAAEMARPFDLAKGPLIRARLLRLTPVDHVLLLTMHHIVSDGWTNGVLNKELAALYEAFRAGRPSPLQELSIQYADFAVWQRGWLLGETLDHQLSYWKTQLAGALAPLELPTDRPRPPVLSSRGARRRFALSPELSAALKNLSRRESATLFMTLLAAFDVLLHRYSGQDDILVGTPIAGRTRPEIEPLVGFFVNTLVLRARLSGDGSFTQLLGRVREACLSAYAHQDIPFERLVADLAPQRDLARTPVVQVMFTLQEGVGEVVRLPSLTLSGIGGESTTAKFDLTLALGDGPTGLLGSLEFHADLYDCETIDRMVEHYRTLLESIVAAPEQPLGELAIMTADERRRVVVDWNATDYAHPTGALVHELFEAQAARTPEVIALSFEGRELTYRELDERSNRLAHALRKRGVGPDALVGVCMDRSLEMLVSLYGVLKAGGAYVPLDPEYPRDRLAFMLEDSKPAVILTQSHLAGLLPEHGAAVILLDTDRDSLAAEPVTSPGRNGLTLDNLAYVIYTSGSTGRPKGAMNAHRGIQNRLLWMQRAYGLDEDDRVLQKTPFSFDVSVWELFWPLMFGARLVIASPEGHRDPAYLAERIVGQSITTVHFVPSMLKAFVDEPGARRCRSLRRVICSGEALSPQLANQLFALGLGVELHNLYGPTEAAIDVTAWVCVPGAKTIPIGRPIDNVRMYVLDERRRPQPIGVPGDLYIGGVQVGRGYLNRPELTAERFTQDPFDAASGARIYSTGDVARWLSTGALEYRGRSDFQVKIRGHRVELGEIEAALAQHPAVREAVVLAREDAGKEKRLVGYLVAGEPAPTVGELRSFLKDRLPDPMIPGAFVLLGALPLTASGKVDRRALPAPEGAYQPGFGEDFVAPQTEVEGQLAAIWSRVLRLERVGIHDNFFAIGGDSILSIQIVSLAQAAGIHLTPRQLFQHQTIAELAAVSGSHGAAPAEQGPVTGAVPLTPVQRWWLELDPVDPDHHNQSSFLEVRAPLEPRAVEAAVAALLEHHDALRLRLTRGATDVEQKLAELGGTVPLTRVDLRDAPDAELTAAIERAAAAAQASLDVARGPALRVVLFDLGDGRPARLLFVVHHLAVDGVSWRILIDDFWAAYAARLRGEPIALPLKTTSFKRWAERLVEHAGSDELARESAYWLAPGRSLARRVPMDHEHGDNTEASARSVVVSLSPEETESLLRQVPEAYRTQINDVLLAAFAQAFASWTGAPAVLVALEGHGREELFADVDVTRTVGWFTAVFPVVLELAADAGPGEALKSIKEQLRAVPARGVGYGLLRYLRRGDDLAERLAQLPQAEVSFNYLGQLDQALSSNAPFRRARESAGSPHGPRNRRRHVLDVNASVLGGRLNVRFTYSENRHQRATIEGLSVLFLVALRALITHCLSPEKGGYTPSDFPLVRLGQGTVDKLTALAGGRKTIEDVYPLSPMQQGILFHVLYASQPGVYYVQLAWTISGQLDVGAFTRAWQEVIDRHAVLRTVILWENLDHPLALVKVNAALPVIERDLRGLAAEPQAREIERFAEEDGRRGFDLSRAPLMRIALLRVDEGSWRFVWGSHHIILDGWSMPLLLKEALQLYEGYAQGRELRLERARQYGDYVGWLVAQDPARAEAFWRRELAGFSAPTPLPGEETRPERTREERFSEKRLRLPEEAASALSAFARRHQLTMSTLVQGAWALLLARYSGEWDVVFGSTVSGRSAPVAGIDRMVGLFINTLAVRARPRPEETALAFLGALQEQQAELREYEHSALAEVQALSAVPRGTPLFETLVVFENQPIEESLRKGVGALSLTEARAVERPPYPVTLQSSFRKTLLLRIGFDAARFDEALIERMLGHLTTVLEGVAAGPDKRLGELDILTGGERQKLLLTWNDTAFTHATDGCIHEVFEAQAASTPEAIALSFEASDLTYRELDERANRLAGSLRKRGVRPGALVGVCLDRALEMVVALYGVLKAGGAYVPLDPEYPRDRLAFMLEDSKPVVILTQSHLAGVLPEHDAAVLRLDSDWSSIASEPAERPARDGLSLESLAYVIYTSGSTGRPKGAMNAHRGILNRLHWMQHAYPLTGIDRVLQKTPFSFDVSVWELFWPLMFGARLVLARPGGHREPAYLVDTIATQRITTMHFVPSMLKVFLDEAGLDRCESLVRVFASGEALSAPLVDRFYASLPGARLHNLYGPTEAAVDVTSFACAAGAASIPIGRPVHNTRIYLLDERLQPVPEGLRGELYIGGVQVGRGYLNRAELTAERFIRDPFDAAPQARLYKTGDLARYLPSGDIEYLGRADFQVKVRGFRIELGEIEADLLGHPVVREAVVVARDEGAGDKRLVAYLVCAEGPRPTAGELRGFLQEKLPDYMVPAAFVLLDKLPLTASGKVDRRALPAPEDGERAVAGTTFAAPATVVEEELSRIWASVLRLEKIGVHDNFFEVGGDSILSIQIVSRAQQAGIRVTPRQIFEHPTIAELAAVAGTKQVVAAEQGVVTGPVPLTPVERWWLETPRAAPHHWNQSVFLELREAVDAGAMEKAVARLLEHHDALRLRIVRVGDAYRQRISAPGAAAPFRIVDLSAVPAEARSLVIEKAAAEAQSSLDLAEGPIVRVVLFAAGAGEPTRLLVVAHHLGVDGVSWRLVLDDLWGTYTQAKRGLQMALPAKTTSFKRWAEKLAEHASSEAVGAEAGHWLGQPRGVAVRLPVDLQRGDNDEASVRTVLVSLAADETEQLLREAPDAYRTQINDLLLTALAQAFAAWTGAPGALFDFEGHGREELFEDVDVTRTVGWFTVVYPAAIELPAAGGAGEAIKSVKEQLRAVPNRGVGYGLLRYLRDGDHAAEELRAMPQAEVSFNYLGQVDQTLPEDAPFRWAQGPSGPLRSPRALRRYLVDVNARIVERRLHVWLGYSENRHRRETMEALATGFIEALRTLVGHCLSPEARGHTPSDFQDANLAQDVIDMLVSEIADDES